MHSREITQTSLLVRLQLDPSGFCYFFYCKKKLIHLKKLKQVSLFLPSSEQD